MTKKQESMKRAYDQAKAMCLWDAYERPSRAKVRAYDSCLADVSAHNGYGQRITGASSHFFSFAYLYDDEAGKHLRYHTHANVYDFIIEAAAELLETAVRAYAEKLSAALEELAENTGGKDSFLYYRITEEITRWSAKYYC